MAKDYVALQRQADEIKNETEAGGNTAEKVGMMFKDSLDFSNQMKGIAEDAKAIAEEAKDIAEEAKGIIGADPGLVIAEYNGGSFWDSIPEAQREVGLIATYPKTRNGDKWSFETKRFTGTDVTDEKWKNSNYWVNAFAQEQTGQPSQDVTAENIYKALPVGSVLFSTKGNIFGDGWVKAEDAGSLKLDYTGHKTNFGGMFIHYGKGRYFIMDGTLALKTSTDLEQWEDVSLVEFAPTENSGGFGFVYSQQADAFFYCVIDPEVFNGAVLYSKDGITWQKLATTPPGVMVLQLVEGDGYMWAYGMDMINQKVYQYTFSLSDWETAEWQPIDDAEIIPCAYSFNFVVVRDTVRKKMVMVGMTNVYERDDTPTAKVIDKGAAPWKEGTYFGNLTVNDEDNTYVLTDLLRETPMLARGKDVTKWEEAKLEDVSVQYRLAAYNGLYYIYYPLLAASKTFLPSVENWTTLGFANGQDCVETEDGIVIFCPDDKYIFKVTAESTEGFNIPYGYIKKG